MKVRARAGAGDVMDSFKTGALYENSAEMYPYLEDPYHASYTTIADFMHGLGIDGVELWPPVRTMREVTHRLIKEYRHYSQCLFPRSVRSPYELIDEFASTVTCVPVPIRTLDLGNRHLYPGDY